MRNVGCRTSFCFPATVTDPVTIGALASLARVTFIFTDTLDIHACSSSYSYCEV